MEIIIMLTYTNSRLIRVNYSSTTLKGQGYPTLCRFCWGENSRKSDCTVLIRVIHGDDRYRALHVNSGRSAGWIAIIHDFSLRGVRIGEALKPGPRLRRRGPRSAASRDRRRLRWAERSRQMRRDENCNDKEVDMNEVFTDHKMSMLQVNMRGYISHIAEIAAMIRLMACKPFIVSLNETFLTRAIEHVELEGYTVLCRHDRSDQWGGGVLVFVLDEFFERVTLLEKSTVAERVWAVVHSDQGPILVCCWYRPPAPGDTGTLDSFEKEWRGLRGDVIGTIVLGDLNVHSRRWLKYSSKETVEGTHLFDICQRGGLKQLVSEPTRYDYLLDLVLSDIEHVKARVAAGVSDHKSVIVDVSFKVPATEEHERWIWQFRKADWGLLQDSIAEYNWECMREMHPDESATFFTQKLLELSEAAIPRERKSFRKCTHPWLTPAAVDAVRDKLAAQGTENERPKAESCSATLTYGSLQRPRSAEQGEACC